MSNGVMSYITKFGWLRVKARLLAGHKALYRLILDYCTISQQPHHGPSPQYHWYMHRDWEFSHTLCGHSFFHAFAHAHLKVFESSTALLTLVRSLLYLKDTAQSLQNVHIIRQWASKLPRLWNFVFASLVPGTKLWLRRYLWEWIEYFLKISL